MSELRRRPYLFVIALEMLPGCHLCLRLREYDRLPESFLEGIHKHDSRNSGMSTIEARCPIHHAHTYTDRQTCI